MGTTGYFYSPGLPSLCWSERTTLLTNLPHTLLKKSYPLLPGKLKQPFQEGRFIEAPKIVLDQQDIFWLFVPRTEFIATIPKPKPLNK